MCENHVFLVVQSLPPESQLLHAISVPTCPQLPCLSSKPSRYQYLSRSMNQQAPMKLMVSIIFPLHSGLPPCSRQYWKCMSESNLHDTVSLALLGFQTTTISCSESCLHCSQWVSF